MYKTQLRTDEITAKKIYVIATKEKRSFNKQVEFIIEQFIKDYEKANEEIQLEK